MSGLVRRLGQGAVAGATALLLATPFAGAAAPAALSVFGDAALAAAPAAQSTQAPHQAAPPVPGRCPTDRVTIRGTTGKDRLVGTPGRDVIDGSTGDDVIDGAGGDDLILGGTGNDTLLGGLGNDVLCGGVGNDVLLTGAGADTVLGEEGDDLISASFGDDGANGGVGNDLLAGGPGNDELGGDIGNDALGGVDGDDRLSGDIGDDRIAGSEGTDSVVGGLGTDKCSAETTNSCEANLVTGSRTATIAEPAEVADTSSYRLDWSIAANAGIRLVEVYANDALIDYAVTTGPSKSGSSTVSVDKLPAATKVYFYVVVTDANGEQTGSDAKAVEIPEQLSPLPPVTVVELNEPTSIASVVEKLTAAGLKPIEYRAERVLAPTPQVDPELAAQLSAEGVTAFVSPDMGVVYNPRSTPLAGQVDDLTAYYTDHQITGIPLISTVLVEGTINQAQAGPLGTIGRVTGSAPGQSVSPAEPAPNFEQGPDSSSGPRTVPNSLAPSAAQEPKTGRVAPEQTAEADAPAPSASARTQAQAAAPQVGFWPKYGRFNVATYERPDIRIGFSCGLRFFGPPCGPTLERVIEKKAEFQHQVVWTRESLQVFAERSGAYEHNVKVESPGRSGTRPFCNPFSEANFYVRAETVRFAIHNVPSSAEYYNDDVIAADPCSSNEVSFGIVYPEKLNDDLPPGQLRVISVRQESARNDQADKSFFMAGQSLSRDNFNCDILPGGSKKICIGLRTEENLQATLARTGGRIGNVELPTCVVYSGHVIGTVNSAERSRLCGRDQDNDGFDDQIDCAPNDPAINPGAVDIPNDGIDQNCDGSDLTVGSGEIQVTLLWDNDNDQDLHVFEPNGNEIWYSSPGPSATGGRLDRDDNVGVCGGDSEPGGVENIFWPTGTTPARGTYRVDVVEYNRCANPAQWTAEVRVGGQLITRQTGTGTGSFTFSY